MNETNTANTCVNYRHWLKSAEVILSLILLVLKFMSWLRTCICFKVARYWIYGTSVDEFCY